MINTEQILNDIHIKWLSKAETDLIKGSEITVLPYGYLRQAAKEAMELQRQQILEAVEKKKTNHEWCGKVCEICAANRIIDSIIGEIKNQPHSVSYPHLQ